MKNIIWIFPLYLLLSGCVKDPLVGDFAMEYIRDVEIPAGLPPLGATFIVIQNIQSNSPQTFAANGVTADDILEIKTSFASMQAINPPSEKYDFLREVTLLMETDELPRIDAAYRENIFDIGSTLDLIPAITDLSEYLKDDQFNLVLKLEPDDVSPSFITTRVRIQFQVFLK